MFAVAPLAVNAQTTDDADSTVAKKKVHVAFRDIDADHLLGGISYIDMEELSKKDYTMSSLEDMYGLVGGWNGNNLWGMDNERLDNNDNSNMPLVIIDGVKRPSNNVLPSEIEQITFLKGAQAVVLYGAKGAKGAIVITTKRSKVDGLQITANANTGWHFAKEFPEYLGSAEYMTLYNEACLNDQLASGPKYSQQDIYNHASGLNPYRYPNVNYYSSDYIRKAYNRSEGTLEIQGGGTRAHFYTNINYYRAEDLLNFGPAKDNYTDRFSVRGNVDLVVNKVVKGFANASATFYNENKNKGNFWSDASSMRPNFPENAAPLIPIETESISPVVRRPIRPMPLQTATSVVRQQPLAVSSSSMPVSSTTWTSLSGACRSRPCSPSTMLPAIASHTTTSMRYSSRLGVTITQRMPLWRSPSRTMSWSPVTCHSQTVSTARPSAGTDTSTTTTPLPESITLPVCCWPTCTPPQPAVPTTATPMPT